jgi:hypothetical protein
MPIISSIVESKHLQADGSYLVVEQHTDEEGRKYTQVYNAPANVDTDAVCAARGVNIGEELDKQRAQEAIATNFEIPLTPVELMRRLSPAEWAAFQESQNENVKYFRAVFDRTGVIYRSDPLTVQGFQLLVGLGIVSAERADEILS